MHHPSNYEYIYIYKSHHPMHHSLDLVKKQKLFNNRMSDTSYEL